VDVPVKEETEAGETKAKYREDNAEDAPEVGLSPLNVDDVAALFAEIDSLTYEDMEEYGMFDDEEDDDFEDETIGHPVEWDDFDMNDVEVFPDNLNEISYHTLSSYVQKASRQSKNNRVAAKASRAASDKVSAIGLENQASKRDHGVTHAIKRISAHKEEVEVTEDTLDEVLSVQGRLKRRFAARKNRQKLKVARNIALRRGSSPQRLKARAKRGARGMVYKRLLRGRDRKTLPPAEKMRLERMIKMYAPLVQRLSVRLLPNMRKMEINRMKRRKGGAVKAKKYKAARPVTKKQTAKKFKIKR